MGSALVLVHSPLAGPATWSWVARALRQRGHRVVVPSLVEAASSGDWEACVRAVVQDAPASEAVLVGHSGAGPLLPAIATRMEPSPTRVVLVDALVPPSTGAASLVPEEFLPSMRSLARGGVLPKWSEWFGPGAMEALVPDSDRRAAVTSELVELPVSFFDARIPVPSRFHSAKGAFVLLSEPYRSEAAEAASRGWAVHEILEGHLAMVNRPAEIAELLSKLAAEESP